MTEGDYSPLQKESLPLPFLTVRTPWHRDHTFVMHNIMENGNE